MRPARRSFTTSPAKWWREAVVLFSGVINGHFAAAATPALLIFILPVTYDLETMLAALEKAATTA
jgi:hypothetical protein